MPPCTSGTAKLRSPNLYRIEESTAMYRHIFACPLGDLLLTATETHLTGAFFPGQKTIPMSAARMSPGADIPIIREAQAQFTAYFAGKLHDFALPMAPEGTAERLLSLLGRFGLPTELPRRHSREAYLAALRVDKKSRGSQIRYIALREIGRAEAVSLTPARILPAGGLDRGPRGASRRPGGRK